MPCRARNDEEKQRQLALTNAADAKRNEQKAIEEGVKAKEAGEKARLACPEGNGAYEQSDKDKAADAVSPKAGGGQRDQGRIGTVCVLSSLPHKENGKATTFPCFITTLRSKQAGLPRLGTRLSLHAGQSKPTNLARAHSGCYERGLQS